MFTRRALLTRTSALALAATLPLGALAQEAAPEVVDMVLGDPDAPVTIIEYASFTCPHCATFHATTFQELKAAYIDTGKVRFIHREVYFDRFGLWAGMVARCGGEMRYFGIAERLYSTMSDWTAGGDPAAVADNLRRIGIASGLEADTVNACLQDAEQAKALVGWYQETAEADGITATPSFVIEGKKYSNMSFDEFAEVIDGLLAG